MGKSIRSQMAEVAPKLDQLTRDVLYGDVWEREQLSKRDRSLVTVAALIALNREVQLAAHFDRALGNGVTQQELGEVVTHIAFYAGWPAASSAAAILHEIMRDKS